MPRAPRLGRALLGALVLAAAPAAEAAGQGNACAPCDSTQRAALERTLRARLAEVAAELERLRPAIEKLSAEVDAGAPMTEARLALLGKGNELRGIEAQLARDLAILERQQRRTALRGREAARVQVEVRTPDAPRAAPTGYIGVSFSGAIEPRPGARRFYFHDFPEIVAVDAGSPAERGGLQAGDVLVMLGDAKLKGTSVDLNAVLRPGAKVPVRFRRAGALREATLVVARTPMARRVDLDAPVLIPLPAGPAIGSMPEAPAVAPVPPTPEVPAAVAVVAPLPPIFGSSGMTGAVGGAEVSAVQGNLRDVLGVDGGLLVLDVGINTPAGRAGLRAGDVIRRADGRPVRTPADLVRVVRQAEESSVKLEVVRKKQTRVVVLRW